jgi:hypothetical protein
MRVDKVKGAQQSKHMYQASKDNYEMECLMAASVNVESKSAPPFWNPCYINNSSKEIEHCRN